MRLTEFFVILGHFLLFYTPNDPENLNFEIMKKCLEIFVNNLVPFRVGGVLHHWYKLIDLIDKLTDYNLG